MLSNQPESKLASQDFKPAGVEAEQRSIAALVALQTMRRDNFHGGDAFWGGCLLQRGRIFRRKHDGAVFVSLGFESFCATGWRLELHTSADVSYFSSPKSASADSLEFLVCNVVSGTPSTSDSEAFEGIPFTICPLTGIRFLMFLGIFFCSGSFVFVVVLNSIPGGVMGHDSVEMARWLVM